MTLSDAPSDAILIEELELSAHIGVPEAERAVAQRLTVSFTLWPLQQFSDVRDDLARTVDYAALATEVERFVSGRDDHLLETLADALAAHLLAGFPLRKIRLELRKFILPNVRYVGVIITRARAQAE